MFRCLVCDIMRRMRDEALGGNVTAGSSCASNTLSATLPGCTATALDAEVAGQISEEALAERLSPDELQALLVLYRKLEDQE